MRLTSPADECRLSAEIALRSPVSNAINRSDQGGTMTLLGITGAWLGGIAVVDRVPFTGWQWLVLGLTALSFLVVNRSHRRTRFTFACAAALALAAAWTHARHKPLPDLHISRFNDVGIPFSLIARVKEPPQFREDYIGLLIDIQHVETKSGEPLEAVGTVLAYAPTGLAIQYGDLIVLQGELETPPAFEAFDYRAYLARQGVHSVLDANSVETLQSGVGPFPMGLIFRFRRAARKTIFRLFPQPESSLLAGILIGDEFSIPEGLRQAFNRTGTTHIIAISGFNITIIAALFLGLFQRPLGARWGTLAALVGVALYTVLVGADAAVVRSAVMAGLAFLALRLGRPNNAYSALAASAFLMTLANPDTVWDAGFQLSFAATLGLVLYGQPMQDTLVLAIQQRWSISERTAARWGGPVAEFFLFTLAAQATTLPLSALYFGRVPLAAGLANPLILPLQPGVMVLAGVATLLGMIWLPLGQCVAWLGWGFAAATIRIVELFSKLPFASVEMTSLPLLLPLLYYAILFGLTLPTWRGSRPAGVIARLSNTPASSAMVLVALAAGTFLSWAGAISRPDGRLHVTVFDLSGGPVLLIRSPGGRNLLFNGGTSAVALEERLGRTLPALGRDLDWIVLSTSGGAAATGLRNLPVRFPVGAALIPPGSGGRDLQALLDGMSYSERPVLPWGEIQTLELGAGAYAQLIGNEQGQADLQIVFDRARFSVPSGSLAEATAASSPDAPTALVLSDSVPSPVIETLLKGGWPEVIILARGPGDAALPLEVALADYPGTLLQTDRSGWVELASDGNQLWVTTERAR